MYYTTIIKRVKDKIKLHHFIINMLINIKKIKNLYGKIHKRKS